ncbi:LysM peptidoglycan-binding domain-containing protein [Cellulophaga sp. F20128]|uniref:LysM peptidoglycan-binding domain-containing protein n=1 Tax=Cellulophaga sp. F20128 TaxID=2926413 RepID=UPI001FF13415|nr:LysM peptidoglycan-binding domain-containing protein [Cellulophaga sp. F20128]MCK0157562.1 LysM peptidoglycan-binding domain-containing protein [Cellulophaga sp. F20128]
MSNKILKTVVSLFTVLLVSSITYAQKYKTHAVKEGESLASISKTYNVAIEDILVYNKEIKKGQSLTVNTILIVPLDKKKAVVTTALPQEETIAQEEPIRFINHKTSRKETLYRLAKDYNVKEEDIKKYNTILYSSQLKKGMELKIPVYRKVNLTGLPSTEVAVTTKPDSFTTYKVKRRETLYGIAKQFNISQDQIKQYNKSLYASGVKKGMELRIPHYLEVIEEEVVIATYTVKAKETRWSIANKFGITIDSLLLLNPELPKATDYLAEGQRLQIPERNINVRDSLAQNTTPNTPSFFMYTIPAKMTFYSLEKAYGVSENTIKELNPPVVVRGLQEGMQIKIPTLKKQLEESKGAVNAENFIFYVVRQGQGELALSRDLGVTFTELKTYNPALEDGIKVGMVLKLPKYKSEDFTIKNSLILPKINLLDSINVAYRPKVMVLLPFRTDILNVNDTSATKIGIERRTDTNLSLGLYSGMQLALEYIKAKGLSVDVQTYDTQSTKSVAVIREILARENLNEYSAIMGPLDSRSIQEVAKKASFYNVPVIAPYVSEEQLGFKNVFYAMPSDNRLREKMLEYVSKAYTDENIIVIADAENKKTSDLILAKYPNAKVVTLIDNLTIHIDKLERLVSKTRENWVFLETSNIALSKHASSVLNSFNTKETVVRMFTTNLNKAFDRDEVDNMVLSNLNFTYPSIHREVSDNEFVKLYTTKFGASPDKYATRGFDIMLDVLLKLAYKNDMFETSKIVGETEYMANKFNYTNNRNAGYTNTAVYIMQYNDMNIAEVNPPIQE